MVVFTESDTTYSRAITGELAKQLKNIKLEIYSYLRALDGRPDEPRGRGFSSPAKGDLGNKFWNLSIRLSTTCGPGFESKTESERGRGGNFGQ